MAIQRKQCLYLILAIVFFLTGQCPLVHGAAVIPGDARTEEYLPLLAGKRVALFCNQTARIGEEHILDVLLKDGQYVSDSPFFSGTWHQGGRFGGRISG